MTIQKENDAMSILVNKYLGLAHHWGIAMSEGDSSKANAIHDVVQSTFKEIVMAGDVDALFRCADDDSDAVRFFVASHIQQRDTSHALIMYEQLSDSLLPFVAVSARHILRELRNGSLPINGAQ